MTDFTSESLEQVLIKINQALECIAAHPTRLIVSKKLLRQAIFIMHSKHKKHMMPTTQRKTTRIIHLSKVGGMNPLSPNQILRNLEHGYFMTHQEQAEAAQYIRQLQQAYADMLSALKAIVAVAETEDSFSMQTIKDCANIAIKQARGEK
jgi:hypothetical protein